MRAIIAGLLTFFLLSLASGIVLGPDLPPDWLVLAYLFAAIGAGWITARQPR